MKNTLAKTLALALCSLLCLGASALELEQVEAVDETAASVQESTLSAVSAVDVDISLTDETYGTLIYYNNFEGTDVDGSAYQNADILGNWYFGLTPENNAGNNKCNLTLTDDPTADADAEDKNGVLHVTYTEGSYPRVVIYPKVNGKHTNLTTHGIYTVLYDFYYTDMGTNTNPGYMFYNSAINGESRHNVSWNASQKPAGTWHNITSKTVTVSDTSSYVFRMFYILNCTGIAGTGSFYVDNIRIYYQPIVEVDLGELPEGTAVRKIKKGEIGSDAFSDTAIVCGTELPELYTVDKSYSFLGWQDEDGNFIKTAPAEHCTVTAKWQEHKPGLNLLTGTTGLADFEDSLNRQYVIQNQNGSIKSSIPIKRITNPFKTTDGEKVTYTVGKNTSEGMLHESFTIRPQGDDYISWTLPVRLEVGRRYTFRWDVYTNDPTANAGWLLSSTASGSNTNISSIVDTLKAKSFGTYSYTVTPTAERNGVSLQYKVNDKTGNEASYDIYFDNFAVYSDYKVTYHYYDGSTESVWYSANGAKTYTPNKTAIYNGDDLKKFIGWSTVENATEPMATVTLANEDFDLYPVWKEFTAGDEYLLSALSLIHI